MSRLPFKKLQIWQKGMELVKATYAITKSFPQEEQYGLISQMQRSAISVPSNIAEGSQRVSDKEFRRFILIAKGSLAEVETQFLLACEIGYVTQEDRDTLQMIIDELGKMLHAFQDSLLQARPRYPLTAAR